MQEPVLRLTLDAEQRSALRAWLGGDYRAPDKVVVPFQVYLQERAEQGLVARERRRIALTLEIMETE